MPERQWITGKIISIQPNPHRAWLEITVERYGGPPLTGSMPLVFMYEVKVGDMVRFMAEIRGDTFFRPSQAEML